MKVERHSKIIEIINKYDIETQEELADFLNKEGYNVTQATVSRDIRDLKLTKVNTEKGQKYVAINTGEPILQEKYRKRMGCEIALSLFWCCLIVLSQ